MILAATLTISLGQVSSEESVTFIWKTVYVDVDGDQKDEPLVLRTDEDVYHLGATGVYHGHLGILGSGPGWGLRYTARTDGELLLDTGVRGVSHYYNTRTDFLENEMVVTEWAADKVLLRRTIDLAEKRAIIVFELVDLLPEHIRDIYFNSQFRFDDYIYPTSPDGQTTLGWDGYNGNSPDTPGIFKILHLPKPDTFILDPGPYYGLTSATWGPLDLCTGYDLEFALIPLWNNGYGSIDEAIEYLDGMVSDFKLMQDEIIDPPEDCDKGLVVDVKPRSCPNPINVKSKGVFPVAILGTMVFDVAEIDVSTIMLEGVRPVRTAVEDVSTPVGGEGQLSYNATLGGTSPEEGRIGATREPLEQSARARRRDEELPVPTPGLRDSCECTTDGPDGYDDLTMKFEKEDVVIALGEVGDRDTVVVRVTAQLLNGDELEGWDCVVIIDNEERKAGRKNPGQIQLEVMKSNGPTTFGLDQNRPNPFRSRTNITFSLKESAHARLTVQDLAGRYVTTLVDMRLPAGAHESVWDATAPPGMYIVRLEAGAFSDAMKVILLK